jgi:drug/metabolite transporter (DMT)-like permease
MEKKTIGLGLIILGIIMLAYTGFTYVTTKRVADIGPIKINKEESHPVSWSPIVGALLLLGGVVIIVTDKK